MKNKVDSKDYQPIRFHGGQSHLASPGKPGGEKDLNQEDPRKENSVERDDDSKVDDSEDDKIDKEETTNEEREREIEKSYEEEDESEKKERTRF